ncbi:MAG TPA: M23 family metallopeptidase [Candidatus Angelobacter sp.]|nr:M23 family metallopeptidase [Candidatus Angelobacter sp.]
MRKFIFVLIVLVVVAAVLLFALSATPAIALPDSLSAIGVATHVTVHVSDPHGIRSASAWVEQNGTRYSVWETNRPSTRIRWSRNVPDEDLTFPAGTHAAPQLKDGKAVLSVEVVSNDFRGQTATITREVTVITRPPSVAADQDQHYLYLGMADLATFNVSGYWTEAGVRVGDQKFRAWPMPDGKPGFFALFAFAWNMPPRTAPVVYASNPAGNEATSAISFQFPRSEQPKYRVRDLALDEHFVEKVVNELDPNGSGDPVTRFVRINSEMRRANNELLSSLRAKTEARFLWSQPFLQQPNTKVEANFADVRNYVYQGKKIDQQVHLGYDLSSTQHADVIAANDGKVIYAAPLGIYGNCIVLDHGYGLQSIYGHLSEIAVHEGDVVTRGQSMGKSGTTGMAGGDHVHFSMQLEGVQIDPKEWWDAHWIQDHVAKRVSLPGFNGAPGGLSTSPI